MDVASMFTTFLINYFSDNICYPPYGCFSKQPPFDDSFTLLPEDPTSLRTSFHLYTRGNKFPEAIYPLQGYVPSTLKINTTTVILAHGYTESTTVWYVKPFVKALLNQSDINVIIVDWKEAARFPYNQAVGNSRIVGKQISTFLENLFNLTETKPGNIHLIGFSLGAHLMGYVGHNLKENDHVVGRITGLDPAGPHFENGDNRIRLDSSDADFVDVIHSDSKTLWVIGLGTDQPLGHQDFYPNGGFDQCGCPKLTTDQFTTEGLFDYASCSHYRAVRYFIESISDPTAFQSYKSKNYSTFKKGKCNKCTSKTCLNMGYHARKGKTGRYFLQTNSKAPFSGFHYIVKLKTSKRNFADSYASLKLRLIGDNGRSAETVVDSRIFGRGSTRTFLVKSNMDIYPLRLIKVKHESGLWLDDSWNLSKVIVIPLWKDDLIRYVGCKGKWLNGHSAIIDLIESSKNSSCT